MNTPQLSLPVSAPIPDAVKKKRVLLIDTSHAKRDLRAEVMRKLGIDVAVLIRVLPVLAHSPTSSNSALSSREREGWRSLPRALASI